MNLWTTRIFETIGDLCGGLISVDEKTLSCDELHWAKMVVRSYDLRFIPKVILVIENGKYKPIIISINNEHENLLVKNLDGVLGLSEVVGIPGKGNCDFLVSWHHFTTPLGNSNPPIMASKEVYDCQRGEVSCLLSTEVPPGRSVAHSTKAKVGIGKPVLIGRFPSFKCKGERVVSYYQKDQAGEGFNI